MKIKKLFIPVLITLLIMTILVGIKSTNESNKLVNLEKQRDELIEANKELTEKIVSSTSLTQIGKSAESLGLNKPEKFVYLTNNGIALR